MTYQSRDKERLVIYKDLLSLAQGQNYGSDHWEMNLVCTTSLITITPKGNKSIEINKKSRKNILKNIKGENQWNAKKKY